MAIALPLIGMLVGLVTGVVMLVGGWGIAASIGASVLGGNLAVILLAAFVVLKAAAEMSTSRRPHGSSHLKAS